MKRLAILAAICLMMATRPAAAGAEVQPVWDVFVEHSSGRWNIGDQGDWENVLYAAAKATKSEDEAVAEFGRRIAVDQASARRYAEVIVAAVVFEQENSDSDGAAPAFVPGQRLYDLTASVATAEPTGRLLFVVGKSVDDPPDAFVRLAMTHPKAASVLVDLLVYGKNGPYLIGALKALPADPSVIAPPVLWPDWWAVTLDSESQTLAAAETVFERLDKAPQTLAWRAALSRYLIGSYLMAGLDAEAIALYRAGAAEFMPFWLEGREGNDYVAGKAAEARNAFAQGMAAALWLKGDGAAGLALLDQLKAPATPAADLIRDAISPSIADADLFTLYVKGRPCAEKTDGCRDDGRTGNAFASASTPGAGTLLAARLTAAGYPDMAKDIAAPTEYDFEGYARGFTSVGDLMPEGASARLPAWSTRLAAYRTQAKKAGNLSDAVNVTVTQLPVQWHEKPLPEGIAPWTDEDEAPKLPARSQLPKVDGLITRHEAYGKDGAIIFVSARYDLSGEVPAYGLWLSLRRGSKWGQPVYLGLQEHFPYVATPGSRLPLIAKDADGVEHLQLEVRVREIDPETITFPPVGLSYTRQADGIYLDILLADIVKDGDNDGLSDIEEVRLGLKPDHRDSDGDGVDDARDPLPLTAFAPGRAEDIEVARVILERLMGHDKGAIMVAPVNRTGGKADSLDSLLGAVGGAGPALRLSHTLFLGADPALFAGVVRTPAQLFVYSPADLRALGREKGVFYPPRITRLYRSLDGKRIFVEWSASWTGGSFLIDCTGKTCSTADLDGWIT